MGGNKQKKLKVYEKIIWMIEFRAIYLLGLKGSF